MALVGLKRMVLLETFDVDPGTINPTNDNSVTALSITTATNYTAIIMLAQVANDRTYSNWNTSLPGTLNELYDNTTTSQDDASVGAAWAIKSAAGATGDGTADLSGYDRNGAILVALKPVLCSGTPTPGNTISTANPVCSESIYPISSKCHIRCRSDLSMAIFA